LRRASQLLAILVASAALTGCGRREVPILGVIVAENQRSLDVEYGACGSPNPGISVTETDDEVRLEASVERTISTGSDDCSEIAQVALDDPLDDRRIIDASTNDTVPQP